MKKMNLKKIVLSLAVVIAVFGLVGFLIINREGKQKKLSGSDILEKMPDLIDGKFSEIKNYKDINISDWEIYRDEENRFEMKLPKDWICKAELDYDNFDPETIARLKDRNIEILSCFNGSAEKETEEKRIEEGGLAVFAFSDIIKGQQDEKIEENYLFLKESGNKLYSIEIGNESRVLLLRIDESSHNKISTTVFFPNKERKMHITCENKGLFCMNFAKSIEETLIIRD